MDLLGRLGETPLEVAPVGGAVGGPHGGGEDPGLPGGDGVLVELDEDPLAAVLGGRHPGGAPGADQGDEPGPGVVDAVEAVHASESEDGVDFAQAIDGEHATHPGRHVPQAARGDDEPAVGILVAVAGRFGQEVVPLGDEQVHRVPVLAAREPVPLIDTLTTKERLARVTVQLNGIPYYITDITLRMLEPSELYRAQGFPDDYIFTHGHDDRVFSRAAQIRMCGNSVSPPPAVALLRANYDRSQEQVLRWAS